MKKRRKNTKTGSKERKTNKGKQNIRERCDRRKGKQETDEVVNKKEQTDEQGRNRVLSRVGEGRRED